MSIWKKLVGCFAFVIACTLAFGITSSAEERPSYTYAVTVSSGNQGTFADTTGIQVVTSSSNCKVSAPEKNGTLIRITGLAYGDTVNITAQAGMVSVKEDAKYYVKGVRESGRDNNTVGKSSFKVEKDQDYVVAYGIKGEMVAYTVNYQDESGKTLLESQTYYGTVGDKPVVAFKYVEGYAPQAYNLTKTLVSNASENVFTFVYKPSTLTQDEQNQQAGTEVVTETNTQIITVRRNNAANGNNNAANGNAANGNNNAAGGNNAAVGGNGNQQGNDGGAQGIAEPQEQVDLDPDVPLANQNLESSKRPIGKLVAFCVIAACSLLALILLFFLLKNKKEEDV